MGRLAEREDAEGDQADGGDRQRPVHVGEAEALGDADVDARTARRGLCLVRVAYIIRRCRRSPAPISVACLSKYASRIVSADGRGGFGAEAAFLDGHDRDDTRVGVRGEHRVPGLVAVAGAVPRSRSCRRRRSGSRRRRRRTVPSRLLRGVRAGPPGSRRGRRGRSRPRAAPAGSNSFSTRPAASSTSMPTCGVTMLAAVAERRVGDRHLQRVGLQVALADRQLDVVAGRPGPVGVAFREELVAPLFARHQAFALAGQVEPGRAGRCPACAAQFCSWLVSHISQAQHVEVDVGGDLQRAVQVDRPEATPPAFWKGWPPTVDRAVVVDRLVEGDAAAFERRQGGDDLEGRAGRVVAFGRAVGQRRPVRVAVELVDLRLGQRFR